MQCADAVGRSGAPQQLALGFITGQRCTQVFLVDLVFGNIVDALKIRQTIRDRQLSGTKMMLERPAWHRAMPVTGTPTDARSLRHIVCGYRALFAGQRQDFFEVLLPALELHDGAVRPRPVLATPMLEYRPQFRGDDRRFVGPLLREFPALVDESMELPRIVVAEAGIQDEQMSRHQHVDVVELQQAKAPNRALQMAGIDRGFRSCPVKALRGERDSARCR